eukprot:scaffold5479_cov199-Amphora_coffeaeformis.AAC.102
MKYLIRTRSSSSSSSTSSSTRQPKGDGGSLSPWLGRIARKRMLRRTTEDHGSSHVSTKTKTTNDITTVSARKVAITGTASCGVASTLMVGELKEVDDGGVKIVELFNKTTATNAASEAIAPTPSTSSSSHYQVEPSYTTERDSSSSTKAKATATADRSTSGETKGVEMASLSRSQSTLSSWSTSSSDSSTNAGILTESSSWEEQVVRQRQQEQQEKEDDTRRPLAGSSTRRIEDDNCLQGDEESIVGENKHGSASFLDNEDEESFSSCPQKTISWRRIPGHTIRVRSANYVHDKVKVPSPGELYECVYVDFLESADRIPNVSSRVRIPTEQMGGGGGRAEEENLRTENFRNHPWHAPDVFVLSLSLPVAPYVLGNNSTGGPSYTISMYYRMKDETRDILKRIYSEGDDNDEVEGHGDDGEQRPLYNAVRLFDQWCLRSLLDDKKFMSRFKLITSIANFETLGIPKYISCWNGKPVLIKRPGTTGFLYQNNSNPHCMEMEISFHPFPWATKKAIRYLCDNALPYSLLNFGFVIEGRNETELPEALVGLCQLCYPKAERAVPSETFFEN